MRFLRDAWTLVVPLCLVVVLTLIIDLSGQYEFALVFSLIGTAVSLIGNMIYFMWFDHREAHHRRLIDATWLERKDLAQSLEQMRRGEGTIRVAKPSGCSAEIPEHERCSDPDESHRGD